MKKSGKNRQHLSKSFRASGRIVATPIALVLALVLWFSPSYSFAGLILGDSVTLTFSPSGGTSNSTIINGDDLILGNFHFDYNAGTSGDIFDFRSTPNGGFFGGATSITLSGLAFMGGASLIGFDLTETNLSGFSYSTTATSVTFSFDNPPEFATAGQVILGRYITDAYVPIPSALWLFGSGLLGLIGIARRKKAA